MPNGMIYASVSHSILPPREQVEPVKILPAAGMDLLKAFDEAAGDLTARACYCSVLRECWQTDFDAERPQSVKERKLAAGSAAW
jgi:hypothetical protein